MKNQSAGQIKSSGHRAAAYWFVDGLPEIAFGLLFLIPGIVGIVMGIVKEFHWQNAWNTALALIVFNGFWILLFIMWAADQRVLDFLKARITYPRTGYARPPENPMQDQDLLVDMWMPNKHRFDLITLSNAHPPDENVTAFKARTIVPFFLASIISQVQTGQWGIAILMIAVAILIFVLNRREARPYSLWSVSTIALAGILSTAVEFPAFSQMFVPWLIGGAWLLAQGGWTLIRYLHSHPRPKALEQNR